MQDIIQDLQAHANSAIYRLHVQGRDRDVNRVSSKLITVEAILRDLEKEIEESYHVEAKVADNVVDISKYLKR